MVSFNPSWARSTGQCDKKGVLYVETWSKKRKFYDYIVYFRNMKDVYFSESTGYKHMLKYVLGLCMLGWRSIVRKHDV